MKLPVISVWLKESVYVKHKFKWGAQDVNEKGVAKMSTYPLYWALYWATEKSSGPHHQASSFGSGV